MNRILSYIIYLALTLACVSALGSCEDRLEYPGYEDIPEGVSTVDLKFSFPEYTPALDSRSAGDAMRKIRTLWLAIYQAGGDADGRFIEKMKIDNFTPGETEPREDKDEEYTGHAEFQLTYPNGRYRIYAIANHDLSDADVTTEDALFHLPLTWNDDVNKDDQMFGWFRNDKSEPDYHKAPTAVVIRPGVPTLHAWVRRAASKLTVAFNTVNLNDNVLIYLKSVSVVDIPKQCYLHSPNNLGEDDYRLAKAFAPRASSSTIYFKGAQAAHKAKEDHEKWPMIGAGDRVFGLYADENGKHDMVINDVDLYDENGNQVLTPEEYNRLYQAALIKRTKDSTAKEHNEYTRALYFYENMQAPGTKGTASDKRQIVGTVDLVEQEGDVPSYPNGNYDGSHNDDGSLKDGAYETLGWKDARPWGSYVEIKGYYESATGKGPITYRFMLGKDVVTNYEAERNHHYKLTLIFNGNANDVDFHIDYEEEAKPGLFAPTEAYVSYLYNQTCYTTVRATPRTGYEMTGLKAVILDNEWRPYDDPTAQHYWKEAWEAQTIETKKEVNGISYSYKQPADTNALDYFKKDDPAAADNCEFGFLSLWNVNSVTFDAGGGSTNRDNKTAMVKEFRKHYFRYETGSKYGTVSLGAREYNEIQQSNSSAEYDNDDVGMYKVTRKEDPVNHSLDYVIDVPLFTRAKTMDPWAVYSGANPYYEHYRYARIRYVATYTKVNPGVSGPETYTDQADTRVLQSRRIDNPRGIYRRENNLEPFHVNLKYLKLNATDEDAFESVVSRGPWTATIESDPHGLVQISGNGQVARGQGGSITGRTDTEIDFVYKPLKNPGNATYGAIITVTYHNNTCVHKIIVKQGYIASKIGKGKTKFSAFNVYDKDNLVKNPLSIGSLFRCYYDFSMPIAESNNKRNGFGVGSTPSGEFQIVGGGSVAWSSINCWTNSGNSDPFNTHTPRFDNKVVQTFKLYNPTEAVDTGQYKIPTYKQSLELGLVPFGGTKNNDDDINYAFGITYGDGAKETLSTSGAWSFSDPNNDGEDRPEGVRGIIIYSKEYGDNIFFPLGATGHGRRRRTPAGYMRYGDLDAVMAGSTNMFRPMAWNLVNQFGGVYWISGGTASEANELKNSAGQYMVTVDFNYGNYMIGHGHVDQYWSSGRKWDALPVRLVKVN